MSRVQQPLPDSLMKAIKATLADTSISEQERFEATLLIATGHGLFLQAKEVDPTQYALPDEQWKDICEMLIEMGKESSALSAVNASFGWMNSGPSSYLPEEEDQNA